MRSPTIAHARWQFRQAYFLRTICSGIRLPWTVIKMNHFQLEGPTSTSTVLKDFTERIPAPGPLCFQTEPWVRIQICEDPEITWDNVAHFSCHFILIISRVILMTLGSKIISGYGVFSFFIDFRANLRKKSPCANFATIFHGLMRQLCFVLWWTDTSEVWFCKT